MDQETQEYNHYNLLGIKPSASPGDIKRAYRLMAQKCHPDLSKEDADIALFISIKKAYDVLIDPEQRNEYNKEKGFSYNEEISIGGSNFSSFDSQSDFEDKVSGSKVELSPDRISTAKVFDSISADPKASGLSVEKKIAQELEEAGYENQGIEQVQGWGQEEDEEEIDSEQASKNKFFSFGKKVSALVSGGGSKLNRKKLKETLKERFSEEPVRAQFSEKIKKPRKPRTRRDTDAFSSSRLTALSASRGERIFDFRVSKLESMVGATRSLASQGRDGEPIIREVNIPAGVTNGQVMEVSWGWKSEKIRVYIDNDPLWDVRGLDIFLRLPITIEEYFDGSELAIPCFGGQARVQISKEIDLRKPIRIQGKGVLSKKQTGDLYVMPYITPPKEESQMISAMLEYIEKAYKRDVRAELLELITDPAWYWSNESGDYLQVPITFVEAYKGGQVTISLDGEKIKVEIPKFCSASDMIEVNFGQSVLTLLPIVLLPNNLDDMNIINAAKGLGQHYNFPVRKNLPKKFTA